MYKFTNGETFYVSFNNINLIPHDNNILTFKNNQNIKVINKMKQYENAFIKSFDNINKYNNIKKYDFDKLMFQMMNNKTTFTINDDINLTLNDFNNLIKKKSLSFDCEIGFYCVIHETNSGETNLTFKAKLYKIKITQMNDIIDCIPIKNKKFDKKQNVHNNVINLLK